MSKIAIRTNGKNITLIIDGDPNLHQPWQVMLDLSSAYNLGTALTFEALKIGAMPSFEAKTAAPREILQQPQSQPSQPKNFQGTQTRPCQVIPKKTETPHLLGDTF